MNYSEPVAVTLSRQEWGVVQEALDEYFYVVEHSAPGGLRASTRERSAARREWLLDMLPRLDAVIHEQAGVGPLLS